MVILSVIPTEIKMLNMIIGSIILYITLIILPCVLLALDSIDTYDGYWKSLLRILATLHLSIGGASLFAGLVLLGTSLIVN